MKFQHNLQKIFFFKIFKLKKHQKWNKKYKNKKI